MHAIVYSQPNCPACNTVKALLTQKGYEVQERVIGGEDQVKWTKKDLLETFPSARSVPQVIINEQPVGGLKDVMDYLKNVS